MFVNAIYSTFSGEVNPFGIGAPTIFLRLQGCHLRCYKKTMGVLCDTPEGLVKPKESQSVESIVFRVIEESTRTGIRLITLSGGDPLWNREDELRILFKKLINAGFNVCVETSGTISWLPYQNISRNIFWILDYKLKSTGVKNPDRLYKDLKYLKSLTEHDYIKFVIYGEEDFKEAVEVTKKFLPETEAKIAFGAYWGGKLSTFEIFEMAKEAGLLQDIVVNIQAHKMAISSNYETIIPRKV